MDYLRQNVWELGSAWAEPILWYARGVKAMQAKAIADPTSWRFYAAIHGFDAETWTSLGHLSTQDQLPSSALVEQYWAKCQHGTWFFLPWHRGYLLAIEKVLRAEIVNLGGPSNWAMPYWNYFADDQHGVPPEFTSVDWPDGKGDNPLYTTQRYGEGVPMDCVTEIPSLAVPEFVGVYQADPNAPADPDNFYPPPIAPGGGTGFGGIVTGFSHDPIAFGDLENQPHNMVHLTVGGKIPTTSDIAGKPAYTNGLLTDPNTAGLDPLFWLHHANIDRLWEIWVLEPASQGNPTYASWLQGPPAVGQQAFMMPTPEAETWMFTPGDVASTQALGYQYDNLQPTGVSAVPNARALRLGIKPAARAAHNVELLGASPLKVAISSSGARSTVTLAPQVRKKVTANFLAARATPVAAAAPATLPDRLFLNLENARADVDGLAFKVFIHLAAAPGAVDSGEHEVGNIGFFGVKNASEAKGGHGGDGATFVIEVTDFFDSQHLTGNFDIPAFDVHLVPLLAVPDAGNVSIGRISIFRQGV